MIWFGLLLLILVLACFVVVFPNAAEAVGDFIVGLLEGLSEIDFGDDR